jgi:hypothetical protein
MEEKLYTGQIAIDQLGKLIASCQFPENRHSWVLAEQIPERAITSRRDPAERKKTLLCEFFKLKKLAEQGIQLSGYSSGRIFREDMELRWEKLENTKDKTHVVYLGTDKYTSTLPAYNLRENECILKATQAETKSYYLFGERLKEEDLKYMRKAATQEAPTTEHFAQVRIPHILRYPVRRSLEPYVRLKVCEYINKETGIVELFRFLKLEPEEKEQEEEKQYESL